MIFSILVSPYIHLRYYSGESLGDTLNPINPVMRLGVFPMGGYIGGNGNHFGINSFNV